MKTISGEVHKKDNKWWFVVKGKPRGPIMKGFSRRNIYKGLVDNPEKCHHNGQKVVAVKTNKLYLIQDTTNSPL